MDDKGFRGIHRQYALSSALQQSCAYLGGLAAFTLAHPQQAAGMWYHQCSLMPHTHFHQSCFTGTFFFTVVCNQFSTNERYAMIPMVSLMTTMTHFNLNPSPCDAFCFVFSRSLSICLVLPTIAFLYYFIIAPMSRGPLSHVPGPTLCKLSRYYVFWFKSRCRGPTKASSGTQGTDRSFAPDLEKFRWPLLP